MSETIVVGYVPRPEGKAALEVAVSEAKLRGANLVVVNSHKGGRDYTAEDALESEEQVVKITAALQDSGVPYEVLELARGNFPGEDILQVAEERRATLLVIGLRKRSPVGKLFLGSNSQQILLRADCPVLAVKG